MDIVRFMGGLGNQMFQYAFLRALEHEKREVIGSLGFYAFHPDLMQFELNKVFKNLCLKCGADNEFLFLYEKWRKIKENKDLKKKFEMDTKERFFWVEDKEEYGNYQPKVFGTKDCVFVGYWQTYKYFSHIRRDLLKEMAFSPNDHYLIELGREISNSRRYVAVHVRRGDYLVKNTIYGGICDSSYYDNAIEEVSRLVERPLFIYFCDDYDWLNGWCKEKGTVIDRNNFIDYKNWYDMYLMSLCRCVVTANSSFSWWGAWLNQREDKIVIAPQRWVNGYEYRDICPENWIRI